MSYPPSLLEMERFVARIVSMPLRQMGEDLLPIYEENVAQEIGAFISPGPYLTAQQRIGIYNQQYWFRLFILLQEQFPTLIRLFGYNNFNLEIAEPYLLCYPPKHRSLLKLGAQLPRWIELEYLGEDRKLIFETALVDAAYEAWMHSQGELQEITLHADLFQFRKEMQAHPPEYWLTADFPEITWGEARVFRCMENF